MLLENALVYHPVRASQDWWPPPNRRVQDIELESSDGNRIHAWWCPVEDWQPARGAMLYCHGNAGNLSHRSGAIAEWHREMNESVLIFDYPGYGRSDGRPSERGCYAAADAAYAWLTDTLHIPPEQILLYGGSLGGGVAVDLACRKPHRALVLVKTFTSMADTAKCLYPWLPCRWLVRNRFDNLTKIGRCPKPIFIAHGTADGLIPFSQGQRLFAAAPEPKRFLGMEGVGHGEGFSPGFFSSLRAFLAETAPKTPAEAASASAN
jgi:uncharacterized protein